MDQSGGSGGGTVTSEKEKESCKIYDPSCPFPTPLFEFLGARSLTCTCSFSRSNVTLTCSRIPVRLLLFDVELEVENLLLLFLGILFFCLFDPFPQLNLTCDNLTIHAPQFFLCVCLFRFKICIL